MSGAMQWMPVILGVVSGLCWLGAAVIAVPMLRSGFGPRGRRGNDGRSETPNALEWSCCNYGRGRSGHSGRSAVGESAVANLHEREPRVSGLIARARARSRLGCRLVYAFRPHYIARVKDSSDAMPSRFGTNQGLPPRRAT
jgi:hypothetical protein